MKELAPDEKQLVDNISEYGWHVIQVNGDENEPSFCYTVGLFETFQVPEIIIIGLPSEVGHEIINIIGDDFSERKNYEPGSYYSDIIEGYDCFMLSVDSSYYKDYFGYGIWYYKNEKFPVMQCLYPDQDGIFPWDWSEDDRIFQPVLGEYK